MEAHAYSVTSSFPIPPIAWTGERVARAGRTSVDQLALTAGRIWRTVDGVTEPVRHVVYHSPSGLSWGSNGIGAADTALSLLVDAGLPADDAWRMHRAFACEIVARWPARRFTFDTDALVRWIATSSTRPTWR